MGFILFGLLAVFLLVLLKSAFRTVPEYERAVVYTLGRYARTAGPGLILVKPFVETVVRVDMREQVLAVPGRDIFTKDRKPCGLDAAVRYRIVEADKAANNVADYKTAVAELARKLFSESLARLAFGDIPAARAQLSSGIGEALGAQTRGWGIEVAGVTLNPQ